jgi:hypothetical protein
VVVELWPWQRESSEKMSSRLQPLSISFDDLQNLPFGVDDEYVARKFVR